MIPVAFSPYMMPGVGAVAAPGMAATMMGPMGPFAGAPDITGYGTRPSGFPGLMQALSRMGFPGGAGLGYPMAAAGPTAVMGPAFGAYGKPAPGAGMMAGKPVSDVGMMAGKPIAGIGAMAGKPIAGGVPVAAGAPGITGGALWAGGTGVGGASVVEGGPEFVGAPVAAGAPGFGGVPVMAGAPSPTFESMMAQLAQSVTQGQPGVTFSLDGQPVLGVSLNP